MLTGDARKSAETVGRETGIDEIHAKLLPENKVEELKRIREAHGSVMFVGDGINDAPVLAGADVGAAMGSGADAAIEAADVVFMTSSMEAIPRVTPDCKDNRIHSAAERSVCPGYQNPGYDTGPCRPRQHVDGSFCGYGSGGALHFEFCESAL